MTFEKQYKALLQEAMTHGVFRNDRTGVGCYSSFNKSLKWSIKETFPMVTSKKIFRKIFNTEFI